MDTTGSKYCRFCSENKPNREIIDLKTDIFIYQTISEKLADINANFIDLTTESLLPKTICLICFEALSNVHDFIVKVRKSQSLLYEVFLKKDDVSEHSVEADHSKLSIKLENAHIELENDGQSYSSCNQIDNKDIFLEDDDSCNDEDPWTCNDLPPDVDEMVGKVTEGNCLPPDVDEMVGKVTEENCLPHKAWFGYPWLCQYCNKTLPDIGALREHSTKKHQSCHGFRCADCHETSDSFEGFVTHVRGHREALRCYCIYCNIKLENSKNTVEHEILHRKTECPCNFCGSIFHSQSSLKKHLVKYKTSTIRLKRKSKTVTSTTQSDSLDAETGLLICDENSVVDKSWTGYTWLCQLCNYEFDDVHMLRSHTKEVHRKCFAMKCIDCSDIMCSFREFVDHVRKHRKFLKQYCQYCNYHFENESQSDHMYLIHNSQKICSGCGEIVSDKDALQSHAAAFSPPKPKRIPFKKRERPLTIEDLTCEFCGKVAKSLSNLSTHKLVHSERNRNYTCDRCGKAFFTKATLTTHSILHENPDPQVCKICKKSFLTIARLKKHVSTHIDEKPHQCQECKRSFRLKEQLKHHMIIHTNEMPHRCQYCDKAFKHKNVMKTHENQHTGARPYSCSECGMDFTNWSNCNKHMKRKHGTTLAKHILTSHGKLPINPKTGKPKQLSDLKLVKDWTLQLLGPQKRGKKCNAMAETAQR